MSTRAAAWLAWSVWSSCVALTALALLLIVLSGSDPNVEGESFIITATVPLALLGFPTVGALIASRRPENTIGWLFCVAGLFSQLTVFADQYAVYALLTDPGSLPGGLVMATVLNWGLYAPPVAIIVVFLPLLFPSGHLPSRRWRPVLWFAIGFVALAMPSNGLFPDPIELGPLSVENPVGIEGAEEILGAMRGLAGVCLLVGGLGALTSLIVRFRRSRGEERQQLKWFTYAAALVPAALVAADFGFEVLIAPAFAAVSVSVGIAILKHHLYEIDIIINRTLVYGVLTVSLAAVYFGGVTLLQSALRALTGQEATLAVVASTLAIAVLFNPLRRRIQVFIDRRFYRRKYDAAKTLEAFSAKLREETDLDALNNELVSVVRETMEPAHVSLWLRPPAGVSKAAEKEQTQ